MEGDLIEAYIMSGVSVVFGSNCAACRRDASIRVKGQATSHHCWRSRGEVAPPIGNLAKLLFRLMLI
jgi:hypothetical protein